MAKQAQTLQELSKRVATNAICTNGKTTISYHNTIVFDCDGESLTLNTDGFKTKTTKDRMNTALALCKHTAPLGLGVMQKNGEWFLVDSKLNKIARFVSDSIIINLSAIKGLQHVA